LPTSFARVIEEASQRSSDEILEVEELYTYIAAEDGVVRAVDGVSFTLREGEILGLVGESGSGKSVTCRTIAGLMQSPPAMSVGHVRYAGFPGRNLLELRQVELQRLRGAHISMIFQDPMSALNPVLRVGDQLEEAVGAHAQLGTRDRRRRAIELLDRVGIPAPERRLRDYPHQFSGGMRQRVLIAIALASRPRILLADEPTTALDVIIQDQILSLLLELQRDFGMSMVLVSHDLGVIAEMCDRIAVMYGGQIVELSDARTLLTEPRHPYTISLLRSLPDAERKARYLFSIPGTPPRLVDIQPGCRFAPRCPLATIECRTWETELLAVEGAPHLVRCRRHDDARRPEEWRTQSYESA
jgi:oligopeptide/dipeptide ABC transporter ATP-binding protein